MTKKIFVLLVVVLMATVVLAQKKPEKPKLHSDFYVGTYPAYRDAAALLSKENAKLMLVGFHQGWDIEKIAKESKVPEEDLDKLFYDLDDGRLAVELDEYTKRPLLPVIRDKDMEKIQKDLREHTAQFVKVLQATLPEIQTTVASLTGAKTVPPPQLLYQVVVGAILFGGMNDSFFEDQTLMVNPPRRVMSQRYYAWLVESEPSLAGILKRDQWESGGYNMVAIGAGLPKDRITLEQLRSSNGMVLDEAEARRFRSFIAIFTRDKLLPHFKKNRAEFLKTLNLIDAGRYVSVSEAFAWYYDQMANGAAQQLASARLIQAPDSHYVFALKTPTR